jgi:hypothetical protein
LSVSGGHLVKTPVRKDDYATVSTDSGTLMLVPQTIAASASQIKATFGAGKNQVTKEKSVSQEVKLEAGKSYTYTVTIDDDGTLYDSANSSLWDFIYTGDVQTFVAPKDGNYQLEVWGAEGGTGGVSAAGGKGGYAKGEIALTQGDILYVYVGQQGAQYAATRGHATRYSFNGGAPGVTTIAESGNSALAGGGGGATDISRSEHETYATITNDQRIIVAGGGGGATCFYGAIGGGYGGGTSGGDGNSSGPGTSTGHAQGGTQTGGGGGGGDGSNTTSPRVGTLGFGGRVNTDLNPGTGGGVYTTNTGNYTYGAGGSGYVGSLTNTTLTAGNASMPDPGGGSNTTGRSGNGYARITFLN